MIPEFAQAFADWLREATPEQATAALVHAMEARPIEARHAVDTFLTAGARRLYGAPGGADAGYLRCEDLSPESVRVVDAAVSERLVQFMGNHTTSMEVETVAWWAARDVIDRGAIPPVDAAILRRLRPKATNNGHGHVFIVWHELRR
jgi:hypothetical protein